MKPWFKTMRRSIASRLLVLALLPVTLMLAAGNASMYWLAVRDADKEMREHGVSIATALAEGSRYAVVSGNVESVDHTVRGLMAADTSLIAVEILDASGHPVLDVRSPRRRDVGTVFETSISSEPLSIDTFDASGPKVAVPSLGTVRVRMSAGPTIRASVERLSVGTGLVLLATLISVLVALSLSKALREPLDDAMKALRDLRERRFDIHMRAGATGELAELQSALLEMASALRLTHEQLTAQVAERTADLNAALLRIQAADAEKSRLIAHGDRLVEEERRRISAEIHDDLNAVLVSVRLQLEALASAAGESGQAEVRQSAQRILELVDAIYARARAIVRKLRPEIIDALGLPGAVEEMVRHFRGIEPKCSFELSVQPLPALPEATAIAAYRMVQEALSNVLKHARARHCKVTLGPAGDATSIVLVVEDDGKGFDGLRSGGVGLGLVGIRERASALGGTLQVVSASGGGTRLTITLPVRVAGRLSLGTNGH